MSDISNNIDSQSPGSISSAFFFSNSPSPLSNSDTIFSPPLNPISIGREKRMSLMSFSKNNIVNIHVYELIVNYFRKDFFKINNILESMLKKKLTFIINDNYYREIYSLYSKVLLLKRFLDKITFRVRIPKRDWVYTNDRDLALNDLGENKSVYNHYDYKNKTIQKFSVSEIVNIFKYSIYGINDEFCYPLPCEPRNPYTNNVFSLKDKILLYNFLLDELCRRKKCIPECIVIYKNSYFNVGLLAKRINNYLYYHSVSTYVDQLDHTDWLDLLNQFINSSQKIYHKSCLKCIQNKQNYRRMLNIVVVLYELNQQGIYEYGYAVDKYKTICKKNNLVFQKNHYLSHRRQVRISRQRLRRDDSPRDIFSSSSPIFPEVPLLNLTGLRHSDTDSVDNMVNVYVDRIINNVCDDIEFNLNLD